MLPVTVLVFAGELYLPYIELRMDLPDHPVQGPGVDSHKVRLVVAYRNEIQAHPQMRSRPFVRPCMLPHTQLHLRLAFEFSVQEYEIPQDGGITSFHIFFHLWYLFCWIRQRQNRTVLLNSRTDYRGFIRAPG